ncbi:hypothetical protein OKW76_12540 [Sphingomonas sp. S1-29]|uniref:hypothetical protein n=1 Tax=Sphingomonas sp. S1-29 TaxID=2991074 RepID=UPI00223FA1FC|nr:hypothetical protein [Sphingomonas sp. S1-29]UZK68857.1 hypothetical protein OKW76_12540 [Sphingomonas sp. S1-29]
MTISRFELTTWRSSEVLRMTRRMGSSSDDACVEPIASAINGLATIGRKTVKRTFALIRTDRSAKHDSRV